MMCALAVMGCLVTASAIVETSMMDDISRASLGQAFEAVIFANIELHVGMVAINAACGYHVYSTSRHSRRVSDASKTEDENNRLNGDDVSTHSEIEHQADLDDASSETKINPPSLHTTYTNNTSNHIKSTTTTHSSTVAGHDNSPIFPSPLSLIRSLSKRKNLPPPTLLPPFASSSSSSQSQPQNHYQLHTYPRHYDDDIDRTTPNEIIAYDVTDTIPLQDSIQKVTEYVVVSTRLSQASSVCPPGNGNWFINGRLP
ncbi:Hypothetical protein PENO1_070190 [Penicillium occitanis (nom. inval.)]|nr:Hypothetical protein PENO1_070190 [Penicillium occitanis (nom. inval.)]PCH01122.1 hypothetical protein PENOC_049900 [Penicillium occitanis (nom. inval.)]